MGSALNIELHPALSPEIEGQWVQNWNAWPTAHAFNHPKWYWVVRKALPVRRCMVVTASADQRYRLFMTAEIQGQGLQLAGSPYLDKGSILWDPELSQREWDEFARCLLSQFRVLRFQEVRRAGHWEMDRALPGLWISRKYSSSNPWFSVDAPQLSAKQRHELRRYTRVLEKKGSLEFSVRRLVPDDIAIMSQIEEHSTKIERNRAVLSDPAYRSWFFAFTQQFKDNCWIALMTLNGQPIAHYAGVCAKGCLLGLHMAFRREHAKCSPGSVLIFNILPLLHDHGIKEFDYGRGQSVMKARFAGDKDVPQFVLYYFRKSWLGGLGRVRIEVFWWLISAGRFLRKSGGAWLGPLLDRVSIRR